MTNLDFIQILGWGGTFAILLAYTLASFKHISPQGFVYQLLNFTGALGILLVSVSKKNWQPAFLNFFWSLIALISLIKGILSEKDKK